MARSMGISSIFSDTDIWKQNFRWMITIGNYVGDHNPANMLPPSRSSRPKLSFKEIEVEHLNETVFFPMKPQWRPIDITVYDKVNNVNGNVVFQWIKPVYNPQTGSYNMNGMRSYRQDVNLEMYDGCGCVIERWIYENAYPSEIDWGDLDMANSDIITIQLTLRYERAYTIAV